MNNNKINLATMFTWVNCNDVRHLQIAICLHVHFEILQLMYVNNHVFFWTLDLTMFPQFCVLSTFTQVNPKTVSGTVIWFSLPSLVQLSTNQSNCCHDDRKKFGRLITFLQIYKQKDNSHKNTFKMRMKAFSCISCSS